MPKPKAFVPVAVATDKPNLSEPTPKRDRLANIPVEKRTGSRQIADTSSAEAISLDKHTEKVRYKIAYSAHKLADELATALSGRNKKDHNYVKSLVWSLGVLFDKLAAGQSEAVTVRIPSKLLENVKVAIAMQIERKAVTAQASQTIDVTPSTALDSESSESST